MDELPPDPDSNPSSDDTQSVPEAPPAPPARSPLIPVERLPQFGCGCTLWFFLLLMYIPLLGYFVRYDWANQLWVFLVVPLGGVIAAGGLMATRRRRWFGIGLLVGLVLFCLATYYIFMLLLEL